MTAYIANHEKKNRIFAKRERELLHALKNDFAEEKIIEAAEKVREAKMNVFKCCYTKSSTNQPHTFSPEEAAKENKQIQRWLLMSADDIIAIYRNQDAR